MMNTVFYCLLAFPGNYVILNKMNLTERKGTTAEIQATETQQQRLYASVCWGKVQTE